MLVGCGVLGKGFSTVENSPGGGVLGLFSVGLSEPLAHNSLFCDQL